MNGREKNKKTKLPVILWLSIIVSTIMIAINIFRWSLIDIFTPFFEPILELIVFGFFIVIAIWSLLFGLINMKSQRRAFTPLLINTTALIIIFIFPFTTVVLKADFYFNLDKRTEVVDKIKNSELVPNVSYNESLINLPTEYKNLSSGGDVVVEYKNESPNVLFFTYRGAIDDFSGFVYISDDSEPEKYDFACTEISKIEKLKEHWYWMECT